MLRQTHTFAELQISPDCWDEIYTLLLDAGYQHTFIHDVDGGITLDMNGIGLTKKKPYTSPTNE